MMGHFWTVHILGAQVIHRSTKLGSFNVCSTAWTMTTTTTTTTTATPPLGLPVGGARTIISKEVRELLIVQRGGFRKAVRAYISQHRRELAQWRQHGPGNVEYSCVRQHYEAGTKSDVWRRRYGRSDTPE